MFSAMDGMIEKHNRPVLARTGLEHGPQQAGAVDLQVAVRWAIQRSVSRQSDRDDEGDRPSSGVVTHPVQGAELPAGLGFYYMPKKPDEAVTADQYVLRFKPLGSRDTNEIGGIRVWFLGFEFALLMGNLLPGVPTMFDGAVYRPAGLRAIGSGTRVRLDWKSGPRSDEIVFALVTGAAEPEQLS